MTILSEKMRGATPYGVKNKILLHMKRVADYLKYDTCKPVCCEINLTDLCPLKCEWCISENVKVGNTIDTKTAKKFLKQFKELGGKAVTFSGGGEPTFHPDFPEIAAYGRKVGLDIGLLTNGVYPEAYSECIGLFNWVRFSLDTINQEKYKAWKGSDQVVKVLGNINALKDYPVRVWVNVNVNTEHTIDDIKNLIRYMPIAAEGIQFRPVMPRFFMDEEFKHNREVEKFILSGDLKRYINSFYGSSNSIKFTLSEEKWRDYGKNDLFDFKYCDGHNLTPVFNSNGDFAVCMYQLTDNRFTFGNLHYDSLQKIWGSERRKWIIGFVRGVDYKNKCQTCCRLAETNKLLSFLKWSDKPDDVNFI